MAATVKAYNLPVEYVLYEMSYTNMIMYGSVLPGYSSSTGSTEHGTLKGDNPRNKNTLRKILFE